jgi:hypothetical protein
LIFFEKIKRNSGSNGRVQKNSEDSKFRINPVGQKTRGVLVRVPSYLTLKIWDFGLIVRKKATDASSKLKTIISLRPSDVQFEPKEHELHVKICIFLGKGLSQVRIPGPQSQGYQIQDSTIDQLDINR